MCLYINTYMHTCKQVCVLRLRDYWVGKRTIEQKLSLTNTSHLFMYRWLLVSVG